jgi:hypothetical protein
MRLLILDNDKDFRRRFSGYIAGGCSDISITVGGDDDSLDMMLQGIDHVIYDESVSDSAMSCIKGSGVRSTMLTGDEEVKKTMISDGMNCVFKYQSAYGIVRGIPDICEQLTLSGGITDLKEDMSVICVSGFSGGCGRTSFSLALARMIRQKTGEGVLVINTSPMSDLYNYFSDINYAKGADMNLLLLNFASGSRVNSSAYMMNDSYGVSCIRPPADYMSDFSSLTADEISGFTEYIREWNVFSTVIFDMDGSIDERSLRLCEQADSLFIIHDDRRHPSGVEDIWLEKIMSANDPDKVYRILNYDISGGAVDRIFFDEESLRTETLYDYCLPADPDSFFMREGCADISMSGAFAAAVGAVYKGMAQ